MDPISALGAASAVIGIAGFALDLSAGLFKIASQVRSAKESLKGLSETVKSTAFALEEIEKLLLQEEEHIRQAKTLRIFSLAGLRRVHETTSQCLVVLWKIEAAAIGGEEPDETAIAVRLADLAKTKAKSIQLDSKFTNPSVGLWDRLVFAISTSDKLTEYGRQLQSFQISLSLIFDVVSLAYLLSKTSLTDTDRTAVAAAQENLCRPKPNYREVADAVLRGQDGSTPTESVHITELDQSATQQSSSATDSREIVGQIGTGTGSMGINAFLVQSPTASGEFPSVPNGTPVVNSCIQSNRPGHAATAKEDCSKENLSKKGDGDDEMQAFNSNGAEEGFTRQPRENRTPSLPPDYEPRIPGSSSANGSLSRVEQGPDLMKVYTLQRHKDWREEKLTYGEILKRLAKLDQGPINALDKKLRLPTNQQDNIDALQARVNEDDDEKWRYQWNLRQLEIIKGKLSRLGVSLGMMTIIVYLQREARQQQSTAQHKKPQSNSPFSCFLCAKPFESDGSLERHLKTHANDNFSMKSAAPSQHGSTQPGLATAPRPGQMQQNFQQVIVSHETVQYTLNSQSERHEPYTRHGMEAPLSSESGPRARRDNAINFGAMEYSNPLASSDVLDDVDFNSYLKDNDLRDGAYMYGDSRGSSDSAAAMSTDVMDNTERSKNSRASKRRKTKKAIHYSEDIPIEAVDGEASEHPSEGPQDGINPMPSNNSSPSSKEAQVKASDSTETDAVGGNGQLSGGELSESTQADTLDHATIEQLMLLLTPVNEGGATHRQGHDSPE